MSWQYTKSLEHSPADELKSADDQWNAISQLIEIHLYWRACDNIVYSIIRISIYLKLENCDQPWSIFYITKCILLRISLNILGNSTFREWPWSPGCSALKSAGSLHRGGLHVHRSEGLCYGLLRSYGSFMKHDTFCYIHIFKNNSCRVYGCLKIQYWWNVSEINRIFPENKSWHDDRTIAVLKVYGDICQDYCQMWACAGKGSQIFSKDCRTIDYRDHEQYNTNNG